jgi:hypothetical protein
MPYYFYIYNISIYNSITIQTTRAKIYLFTMETLYKIDSRILVLASTGQGNLQKKVPVRKHPGFLGRVKIYMSQVGQITSDNSVSLTQSSLTFGA